MTTTPAPASDIESSIADIARLLEHDMTATTPLPVATASTAAEAQVWLAGVRNKKAALRHPRIALFATNTQAARLAALQKGDDPLCALAQEINADLQVYEVPASEGFDRAGQLHAMTYGMMAVQPGLDALAIATLDNAPAPTFANLEDLLASKHSDIAAALGALMAARLARVPVIADGAGVAAAVALLERIHAGNAAHVVTASPLLGVLKGDDGAINAALALGQIKYLAALSAVK